MLHFLLQMLAVQCKTGGHCKYAICQRTCRSVAEERSIVPTMLHALLQCKHLANRRQHRRVKLKAVHCCIALEPKQQVLIIVGPARPNNKACCSSPLGHLPRVVHIKRPVVGLVLVWCWFGVGLVLVLERRCRVKDAKRRCECDAASVQNLNRALCRPLITFPAHTHTRTHAHARARTHTHTHAHVAPLALT